MGMPHPFESGMPKWSTTFDLEDCRQMVLKLGNAHGQQCRAATEATEELIRVFASLTFHAEGCRVAQAAIEAAGLDAMVKLASQLRGHVVEAIESPHANYVVQKVIEILPPSQVSFVIKELSGCGMRLVKHSYGVRIFCRLVEHCCKDMVEDLIAEVTQDVEQLCCDKYGSYFAQHLIEHDCLKRGQQVLGMLVDNPTYYASSWRGCELICFAMGFLDATQRRSLFERFLDDTSTLLQVACSSKGQNLVSTLLALPESGSMQCSLHHAGASLQASRHGRRVLAKLRDLRPAGPAGPSPAWPAGPDY